MVERFVSEAGRAVSLAERNPDEFVGEDKYSPHVLHTVKTFVITGGCL